MKYHLHFHLKYCSIIKLFNTNKIKIRKAIFLTITLFSFQKAWFLVTYQLHSEKVSTKISVSCPISNMPTIRLCLFKKKLWFKINKTNPNKLPDDNVLREELGPIPSFSVTPDWSKPITMLSWLSPVIDLDTGTGNRTREEIC